MVGVSDHVPAELLDAAVESCRAALADYEAGLLTDGELRSQLFLAGLVQRPGEAWLLDLEQGEWHRYDGVSLTEPQVRVRAAHVERWRDALDRLQPDRDDPSTTSGIR